MPKTSSRASDSGISSTCGGAAADASTSNPGAPAPCCPLPGDPGPAVSLPGLRPRGGTSSGPARAPRIRSRIGVGAAGGFYPAPHRYELYLSQGCPRSLRLSVTLRLLGLQDSVATTVLGDPAATPGAFTALRRAYEATWHHYEGPLTAPTLCDRWSGRVVSNHTPDILRDLAGLPGGSDAAHVTTLRPAALAADIDALSRLLDRDVTPAASADVLCAALEPLDRRLAAHPYVLGRRLTAADVDLWAALTQAGPAGVLADTLALHPRLDAYARRLGGHPAFWGARCQLTPRSRHDG
ncbi:glutathione S-transferase C-terminal domain-containing protein [Streptomyces sp. Tue6028]|uniref:glutathione S-transferase C-terminal domain-containing protein n=1 Tax=Streptomyces sp. Tue6028 TaxID=2036037 RepID=UPI003D7309B1